MHQRLARVLKRVAFNEEQTAETISNIAGELGQNALEKIKVIARGLRGVHTPLSPRESADIVSDAFARRKKVLGSYSYLQKMIDPLSACAEVECPVCMDKTESWCIGKCGHHVCFDCSSHDEIRFICPTCRDRNPAWKAAEAIARMRAQRGAETPVDAAKEEARLLDTSSKLNALANLLLQMGQCDRALIICPGPLRGQLKSRTRANAAELEIIPRRQRSSHNASRVDSKKI